jgi:hypothetical protein
MFGKLLTTIFSAMAIIAATVAHADAAGPQDNNSWQDKRFDWVLKIQPSEMSNYAQYRGTKLTPVSKVKVSFRAHGAGTFNNYEELWYANGKALGCNRTTKLTVDRNSRGAIVVDLSKKFDTAPAAMAHAIARLTVETGLQSASVVAVVVEEDSIQPLSSQLKKYGFTQRNPLAEPNQTALTIVLTPGSDSSSSIVLDRAI